MDGGLKKLKSVGVGTWAVKAGDLVTTFRFGDRWRLPCLTRETVELWECVDPHPGDCDTARGCSKVATAMIVGYVEEALWEIPAVCWGLHQGGAFYQDAVMEALRDAYGPQNVTPGSIYLVPFLQVLEVF